MSTTSTFLNRLSALLGALVLLVGVEASAGAKFLQTADPQIGAACANAADAEPTWAGMTWEECYDYQRLLFHHLLEYAEKTGVTDVFVLGDLTNDEYIVARHADQRTELEEEFQEHPGLNFHLALGNHDMGGSCLSLDSAQFWNVTGTREIIPHWQEVVIGTVSVFILHSQLWAYDWPMCRDDSISGYSAQVGECHKYDGTLDGTCTLGQATDGLGQADCDSDEVCLRYEEYSTSMMDAFETWATACGAALDAGTLTNCFVASHIPAWNVDNVNTATLSQNGVSFNDFRTCDGGADDGRYCTDWKTWCPGGCPAGCAADGGTCDLPVVGFDMRTQFEAKAKAGLGTHKLWGMFGHLHNLALGADPLLVYDGTSVVESLDYEFVGAPSTSKWYGTDHRFAGVLWNCNDSGDCTYKVILANPTLIRGN